MEALMCIDLKTLKKVFCQEQVMSSQKIDPNTAQQLTYSFYFE